MIGLLLLAIVAIYIAFAVFVVTRARARRTRLVLAVVMIVLPFVERSIATIRFEWLCRTEYGVHRIMPVSALRTLEMQSARELTAINLFARFESIEQVAQRGSDGRFIVYRRDDPGLPVTEIMESAESEFTVIERNHVDWLNIHRHEIVVYSTKSGEIHAQSSDFRYWGGLLIRMLSGSASLGAPVASYKCGPRPYPSDVLAASISNEPYLLNRENHQ